MLNKCQGNDVVANNQFNSSWTCRILIFYLGMSGIQLYILKVVFCCENHTSREKSAYLRAEIG